MSSDARAERRRNARGPRPVAVARQTVCSTCDRLTIVSRMPGAICGRCSTRAIDALCRLWGWRKPSKWAFGR